MEINKWIAGYKVQIFPWVDKKSIYVNVQYFKPGSSIERPPAFDKSALFTDDEKGRKFVYECTDSCISYIAGLNLKINEIAHIKIED